MICRSEHRIIIPDRLPSQNEWIAANRSSWYIANGMKRDIESMLIILFRHALDGVDLVPPVEIDFRFYEKALNRDLDNVLAGAAKPIQDALVAAGFLKNDSPKYIRKITGEIFRDSDDPRIEMIIREV